MIPFLSLVYEWIWKYAMPSITGSICYCKPLMLTLRGGWWTMAAKSKVNQRSSLSCCLIGWRRKEPGTVNSMVYSVGQTYSRGVDEIPASSHNLMAQVIESIQLTSLALSSCFRQICDHCRWQPATVFSANGSPRVCKCLTSMHSESHSFRWPVLSTSSNAN